MSGSLQDSFIPELEMEVLGALLMTGDVKYIPSVLKPEHFLEPIHRRIYGAMLLARDRYRSIRSEIVIPLMKEADDFEATQKLFPMPLFQYMAKLVSGMARGPNGLKDSVTALLHQWARFQVASEAERIAIVAAEPSADPVELIKTAAGTFDDVSSYLRSGSGQKTSHSFAEATASAIDAVSDAMRSGTGLTGTTWGLADIDRATGGLQSGEMVILGARPSMGKTAVALSIGLKAAQAGAGVGVISLEMVARSLAMRALTDLAYDQHGSIAYNDLVAGRITESEFEKVVMARERFRELPIRIEDASGLSMTEIRVKCDRMCEAAERKGAPLKVLIVDYLQLIAASARYQGNRTAEVSEISAGLRNLAREYGISVLALSQLSRQLESREDKRPMLSDLRESGSIEQDADAVAFIYRDAYYISKARGKNADEEAERLDRLEALSNRLEFIIAKQRMGATKSIDLFVDIAASAVRNAVRV